MFEHFISKYSKVNFNIRPSPSFFVTTLLTTSTIDTIIGWLATSMRISTLLNPFRAPSAMLKEAI